MNATYHLTSNRLFLALSSAVYWMLKLVSVLMFVQYSGRGYVITRGGSVWHCILFLTFVIPIIGHLLQCVARNSLWICTFPLVIKYYCEARYLKSKSRWHVISLSSSEALLQHRGRKGIVLAASCITRFSITSVADYMSGDSSFMSAAL